MNKKILFFGLLALAISGVVFKSTRSENTEVENLRKQHISFFRKPSVSKNRKTP